MQLQLQCLLFEVVVAMVVVVVVVVRGDGAERDGSDRLVF